MEVWRGRCRAFEGGRNAKSGIISVVFVPSRPWAGGRCVPGRPRCLASGAAPGAPGGPGARAARDSREGVGRKGLSSEGPARGRTRRPAWPWPPAPQGTGGGGPFSLLVLLAKFYGCRVLIIPLLGLIPPSCYVLFRISLLLHFSLHNSNNCSDLTFSIIQKLCLIYLLSLLPVYMFLVVIVTVTAKNYILHLPLILSLDGYFHHPYF